MKPAVFLLIVFLFSAALSLQRLKDADPVLTQVQAGLKEVLYLPSGPALEFMSFGYKNMLADLLWFNTINYFGKHYASDRNYQWLSHMCDLVTSLDAGKDFAYEFCSMMLSWEAGAAEDSIRILNKAVQEFPENWHYYYLRGFTYMFFFKDDTAASRDFMQASQLPGAHPIAARMAAKKLALHGDPQQALVFLDQLIRTSKNPYQQKALQERLLEVRYELDFQNLERALQIFESRYNRKPAETEELITAGIISSLPLDPFGGKYFFDATTGVFKSTSGHKRMHMFKPKEEQK